jgi:hypothetical protein
VCYSEIPNTVIRIGKRTILNRRPNFEIFFQTKRHMVKKGNFIERSPNLASTKLTFSNFNKLFGGQVSTLALHYRKHRLIHLKRTLYKVVHDYKYTTYGFLCCHTYIFLKCYKFLLFKIFFIKGIDINTLQTQEFVYTWLVKIFINYKNL